MSDWFEGARFGMFNPDPTGDLVITVPPEVLDPLATVLEVEIEDAPPAG